jgi:hypothetical protein
LSLIKHQAPLPEDVKAGRQKGMTGPGEWRSGYER